MKVEDMMTTEQRKLIDQPKAWDNLNRVMGHQLGATCFQMTGHFHMVMGLPAPNEPIMPSVTDRELRLRLVLEEFLELVEAMGFELAVNNDSEVKDSFIQGGVEYVTLNSDKPIVTLRHIEGSRYDVVETADALGDMNVIVNGTGVAFGIPMHFIDYEIYTSNLSKLDENGKPIVNRCTNIGCEPVCDCGMPVLKKPDAPIGKILKPESYVPANIPAVLVAYQNKEI